MKYTLPRAKDCFCCGTENPDGLRLTYFFEKDRVFTEFIPEEKHGFSKTIMNTGIALGVLIEAMGWVPAFIFKNPEIYLADLNSRILKPIPIGGRLKVSAEVISVNRWLSEVQGFIKDGEGDILIRATGKFIVKDDKDNSESSVSGHFFTSDDSAGD